MSTLAADGMPPLREVIAQHGLAARKSLGQNFLLDLNVTGKIARASGPLDGVSVVEVGPGPGGLTRALLAQGARRVIAIERDERCLPALAEIAAHWPGRLQVIHGDALEIRPADLVGPGPARIVANLPYNVATVLLANWLEADSWPPPFDNFTLMFQREVAERIVAGPSAPRDYGRLSVLAGWRAKSRILFDLPSSVFTPPPKVVSSVVQVVPDPEPLPCRTRDLVAVAQSAFGQRRKMLRQSLKGLGKDPAALLEAAGIDPTARAETVPVAGFVALARALHAARDTRSEA